MKLDLLRLATVLAVVVLATTGCGRRRHLPTAEPPQVTVAPAIERQVIDFNEYTGHIEAIASVDVYAKVSGYLEEVAFVDGANVKAGQLLYLIDKRTYEAEYNQALSQVTLYKAKAKLAEATLARNEKLVGNGAVSQELYDQSVAAANEANAEVAAAEANVAAAKVNLDYCTITAAIDGRIDRTYVTKGNLVQSGVGAPTLLTTLVSVDPMYVYFDIDELALLHYIEESVAAKGKNDDGSLRERKIPLEIMLADGTTYPHLGTIDFGSNQVTAGTGTLTVRAEVANPKGTLRPGLFARVKVAAGPPYNAVLVPERAIGADQSDRYVYVLDDKGNAQRRGVTLGTKQGPLRVIQSGLKEGEKVIINGTLLVRPGKPVVSHDGTMPEPPPIDKNILRNAETELKATDTPQPEANPQEKPADAKPAEAAPPAQS